MVIFWEDFTKRASDLWKKKKFQFDRTLNVKVDSGSNISWEGNHVLKDESKADSKITLTQKQKGFGDLKLEWGAPAKTKFEVKTKELMDNSEVKLTVNNPEQGNLVVQYGQDDWAAKVDAQYKKKNVVVDAQASFAWEKVTVGAHGVFDSSDSSVKQMDVGVRLDQDQDRTYVLRSKDRFNELEVAFYNKVSSDSEIGAEVDINMSKGSIGMMLGGSYRMDDTSKLRYNLNQSGDIQAAYEYKLSNNVTGYVGTKYSLTENAMADGFGYKLEFSC